MFENTIRNILKNDSFTGNTFNEVYARNEIPDIINYPACIVINTKPRNNEGEHWLAVYYDKNKNAEFFDSYGHHPEYFKLTSFLNKTSNQWI